MSTLDNSSDLSHDFRKFKRRIILESSFAAEGTLFGLSKEHIEIILGIPMPMLMESADRKLQKHILREQFIYEQFLKNIGQAVQRGAQAISGQLQRGKAAATSFGHAAKHAVHHALEVTVKGPGDLIKFLAIVVKQPKYLQIFWTNLGSKLADIREKISGYFEKLGERLKKEAKADKITSLIMNGWEKLKGLLAKVDSMKGWQQALLGLGLFLLCSYILKETGGIEVLEKAFEHLGHAAQHAVGDIGHAAHNVAHSAEQGVRGAQQAVETGEKVGKASAAVGAGLGGILGTVLVAKLTKLLSEIALSAIGGLITGGVWTSVHALLKVIGNFIFVATILSPITEAVIKQYNKDQEMGLTAQQSQWFAQGDKESEQAGQQAQMAENYIKLADILF